METLQLYYKIPLFAILILAVYTLIQLKKAKNNLRGGSVGKAYNWFIASAIFFLLWSIFTIIQDFSWFSPSEESNLFIENIFNPLFLLISIICIVIAAKKTQQSSYSWEEG